MSIFAFCAFLPREFERNRTLSKKTIYRLRKSLEWCIIKLKIRLRIFLYTPVLCLWSSDDHNLDEEFNKSKILLYHIVPLLRRKNSSLRSTYINLLYNKIFLAFIIKGNVHPCAPHSHPVPTAVPAE